MSSEVQGSIQTKSPKNGLVKQLEELSEGNAAKILYTAGDLLAVRPQAGSDLSERLFVICEVLGIVARGCGEFIVRRYDEKPESFGEWQPSVKTTVGERWPTCLISMAVRLPGDGLRLNLAEQRRVMDWYVGFACYVSPKHTQDTLCSCEK